MTALRERRPTQLPRLIELVERRGQELRRDALEVPGRPADHRYGSPPLGQIESMTLPRLVDQLLGDGHGEARIRARQGKVERETGLEPATFCLGSRHSAN